MLIPLSRFSWRHQGTHEHPSHSRAAPGPVHLVISVNGKLKKAIHKCLLAEVPWGPVFRNGSGASEGRTSKMASAGTDTKEGKSHRVRLFVAFDPGVVRRARAPGEPSFLRDTTLEIKSLPPRAGQAFCLSPAIRPSKLGLWKTVRRSPMSRTPQPMAWHGFSAGVLAARSGGFAKMFGGTTRRLHTGIPPASGIWACVFRCWMTPTGLSPLCCMALQARVAHLSYVASRRKAARIIPPASGTFLHASQAMNSRAVLRTATPPNLPDRGSGQDV